MNTSSFISKVMTVRNRFYESCTQVYEFIQSVCGLDYSTIAATVAKNWTFALPNNATLQATLNAYPKDQGLQNFCKLQIYNLENDLVSSKVINFTDSIDLSNVVLDLLPNMEASGYEKVTTLISTISAAASFDEAVYRISELFYSKSTVSLQNIVNVVDDVKQRYGASNDISALKTAIISSASETFSALSFFSILKSITTDLKVSVDDTSLELPENSVYKVQAIITTVFNTLITIAATILAMIGTIVIKILSLIVAIVSRVVQWFTENVVNTNVTYNSDELNNCVDTYLYSGNIAAGAKAWNLKNIPQLISLPGADMYAWGTDNANSLLAVFMNTNFDLAKWFNDCYNLGYIAIDTNDYGGLKILNSNALQMMYSSDYSLSSERQQQILGNYSQGLLMLLATQVIAYIIASTSVSAFVGSSTTYFEYVGTSSPNWSSTLQTTANSCYAGQMQGFIYAIFQYASVYGTSNMSIDWLLSAIDAQVSSYSNALTSESIFTGFVSSLRLIASSETAFTSGGYISGNVSASSLLIKNVNAPSVSIYLYPRSAYLASTSEALDVPSYPTSFTYESPNYSLSSLYKLMLTVGVVVASVAIVAITAKVVSKRLMTALSVRYSAELNGLSDTYNSNPTQENLKALLQASRAYNFKARLFGWAVYDPSNQWFDSEWSDGAAEAAIGLFSGISSITESTDNITTHVTSIGETTGVIKTDVEGSNVQNQTILKAITG